jgi:hypothetical protein
MAFGRPPMRNGHHVIGGDVPGVLMYVSGKCSPAQ